MRAVDYVRVSTDELRGLVYTRNRRRSRHTPFSKAETSCDAGSKKRRGDWRFGPLTSSPGNQPSRLSASPCLPIIVPSMRRLPMGLRYA
jgi:hypothetical protein